MSDKFEIVFGDHGVLDSTLSLNGLGLPGVQGFEVRIVQKLKSGRLSATRHQVTVRGFNLAEHFPADVACTPASLDMREISTLSDEEVEAWNDPAPTGPSVVSPPPSDPIMGPKLIPTIGH